MANTTNFGWETPDDTDLVKDGAAAMRTLGNSIDASFVDLKGGTTGQILAKNSNTDLDFVWVANDQGDITAVTAGTGISGGGTSGAVTITNSMATEIDAKGDLIVGTGADTFARLPVGTNGYTLAADSSVSPTGLKWVAPSSYAVFTDEKSSGTHGGTFTSGAWRTRDINTTQYNDITGASISSNQITLPAGTYQFNANCPGQSINQFASRLYNITDSSITILGSTEYTDQSNSVLARSVIQGIFTIAGTKVFEIQNQCGSTKTTTGFGQATGYQAEVYTIVNITKI